MKQNSTQLSAATALVQILTERPDLSEYVTWSVTRTNPTLVGYINNGGGMYVLADCAEFLGGSVRAGHEYESRSGLLRQHVLSSVWRDVPVEVVVSTPVPVVAVAS